MCIRGPSAGTSGMQMQGQVSKGLAQHLLGPRLPLWGESDIQLYHHPSRHTGWGASTSAITFIKILQAVTWHTVSQEIHLGWSSFTNPQQQRNKEPGGKKCNRILFTAHTHTKTPLKVNICLLQSSEVKREVLSSLFPQDLLECVCFCGGWLVVSLFTMASQSPIFYWNISTGPPIRWQADLLALGHWGELCSCRPDALLCLEKEERKRESEKKILNRLVQVILHAGIMKYKNAFKGLISYF